VERELIEPLQGPSSYEEFLNEHGEGLHYLGYFETEGALGHIIEAIEMPADMPDSERTFPEYARRPFDKVSGGDPQGLAISSRSSARISARSVR
jgi:hypothetical protein